MKCGLALKLIEDAVQLRMASLAALYACLEASVHLQWQYLLGFQIPIIDSHEITLMSIFL